MRVRRATVPTLLALAVCAGASTVAVRADRDEPAASGLVESARVDVVEAWPFVVRPASARHDARCAALAPGDLEITEAGHRVEIVDVAQAPPLAAHVLLLDTSHSMSAESLWTKKKNRQMKRAARSYVDWMLEEGGSSADGAREELVVFTFDDNLRMIVPPTRIDSPAAAARVKRRIDRIDSGYMTELIDSLIRIATYLDDTYERSVVILLSDGADRNSRWTGSDVMRALTAINTVTVFPIFIGRETAGLHIDFLDSIAAISGGHDYYSTRGLESKFRDIRDRIQNQRYVSYRTREYGGLPGDLDNVDRDGGVVRELRIRSRVAQCNLPDDGYRSIRYLRKPAAVRARETGGAKRVTGAPVVEDLVRDWGPLLGEGDKQWEERTLDVRVSSPSPETAFRHGRAPEDTVHDWLLNGAIGEQGRAVSATGTLVLNGKTWLDHRKVIAHWVFERFEPYRRWATARAEQRLRRLYDGFAPEEVEAVVLQRLASISPQDYVRDLAAWHGDVTARELSDRLQRKQANLLLSGEPRSVRAAETVQRRWQELGEWLPYPERVRVIALLELSCDSGREVCGFHRIVLPRLKQLPEELTTPHDLQSFRDAKVPLHPVGLMTVRWLAGLRPHPTAEGGPADGHARDGALDSGWEVTALAQRADAEPARGRRPEEGPHCTYEVDLSLRSRASSGSEPFDLRVIVDGYTGLTELPARGRPDDRCDLWEEPLRIEPRCHRGSGVPPALQRALTERGLPACGQRIATAVHPDG